MQERNFKNLTKVEINDQVDLFLQRRGQLSGPFSLKLNGMPMMAIVKNPDLLNRRNDLYVISMLGTVKEKEAEKEKVVGSMVTFRVVPDTDKVFDLSRENNIVKLDIS